MLLTGSFLLAAALLFQHRQLLLLQLAVRHPVRAGHALGAGRLGGRVTTRRRTTGSRRRRFFVVVGHRDGTKTAVAVRVEVTQAVVQRLDLLLAGAGVALAVGLSLATPRRLFLVDAKTHLFGGIACRRSSGG